MIIHYKIDFWLLVPIIPLVLWLYSLHGFILQFTRRVSSSLYAAQPVAERSVPGSRR